MQPQTSIHIMTRIVKMIMSSCFLFYLFFTITACNSSDTTVKIEQINAGIWKISAGKPEIVNLLSELDITPRDEAIRKIGKAASPVAAEAIEFKIIDGKTYIRFPLEKDEKILSCSWHVGYLRHDCPEAGCGIVVIPSSHEYQNYANQVADELAKYVFDKRHEFHCTGTTASADGALKMALEFEGKPVFITDSGDNVTSGAMGSNTFILHQFLGVKELKKKMEEDRKLYPSVSYKVAKEIEDRTGMEIRVTVPGHTQRGGSPCPYDRVLSTRLGSAAAKLILNDEYGYMVGLINGKTKKVPLEECAGKLKVVTPDAQEIKDAKRIGISFGD